PSPNRVRWLLGGWELSSLFSFHTGQPFNITTANDSSGTDEFNQRPNLIGDPFAGVSHDFNSEGVEWVNAEAFAQPADGTFGNLARNKYVGPGFGAVDFSVFKNTKITERFSTQLRFEMYNLFNRVNLAPPSVTWDGPTHDYGFGVSSDTIGSWNGAPGIGPGEPFNMQLALKFIFLHKCFKQATRRPPKASAGVVFHKFWGGSWKPIRDVILRFNP